MSFFYRFRLFLFLFIFINLNAAELKKVTLQLAWFDQFQYAGYYMAKEKGFYKDVGLDVEIIPFAFDKNIISDVNSGKTDFAIGRENLILEKQKYPNIVALAAIFQASPLILISTKDSKISDISDFVNKRVMTTIDDATEVSLKAMIQSKKVDLRGLNFIPHTHNIRDLLDKKTDLISAYTSKAPFFLKKWGVEFNVFSAKDYGFDMYSDFLYTNSKFLEDDANSAILFKNASLKGWEYAYSNIIETSDIILNKYNNQNLTKDELIFEAKELEKLSYYETKNLGDIKYEKLKRIYDLYNIMGLVEKNIDLRSFIYSANDKFVISGMEKEYLNKKDVLSVCVVPNFMPYSDIVDGRFVGFISDYISIIEESIKKPIKPILVPTWNESLEYIKEQKCDILPIVLKNEAREKYLSFSNPYIKLPLVMVTKSGEMFVDNLSILKNKTISITRSSAFYERLKNIYKNIDFIEVINTAEGFEKVINGEIFAHIDFMQSAWYQIQINYPTKLQISSKLEENEDIHFAVLKENIALSNILNSAILSLDKRYSSEILNKWTIKDGKKEFNYTLLLQISFIVLIVFALGVYRQILLNKANKRLKYLVDLKTKRLQNVNKRLSVRIKKTVEVSQEKDRILAQQQKMISMGQMIENIAHQWRQPLSLITTNASALKLKQQMNILKDDELLTAVDKIVNTSKYLSQTIDDFRHFFKPQKNKEVFSLDNSIKKAIEIVKDNLDNKNIKLIINTKDIQVFAYESEFIQVLINILNNSKDAFEDKVLEEKLIFINLKVLKKKVYLEIYDNALGIPQEILDKVFEPYFTTKHTSQGTGIGLYMSKEIIERHMNGDIFINNIEFTYRDKNYSGAKTTIILNIEDGVKI